MTRLLGTWAACALLAACGEPPHEGVKLVPRAAPTAPATAGPASPPTAGLAAPSSPPTAPAASARPATRSPMSTEPPAAPGRLVGDAAPPLVQPGEPTGNDRFREALQQRMERQAATP